MEDPNDIVKTILFRQSEHIKEFEDSYAQQKELLHLRSAQQIMEEVRYHTLNRDQPNERHKQFLEQYLWTLEEIENRFISIGDRKAELETLYSSFPCDHIKMLLNKAHTGFHAKFLVPREVLKAVVPFKINSFKPVKLDMIEELKSYKLILIRVL
ncbi:hypothetical protein B9Z55_011641 [Caenorhabditis nigoni]|uniref:Uncharacterized protein n=1 Tax=Caenorhabditis nigoni TaxID=1611254 RepID=A0A2G5UKX5_9PELO|nr:hypothetical protein B9Z55_011641 [Caenorhabditis nigoni]